MSYLSYKDLTTLSRKLFYLFPVQLIFCCFSSWNYLPQGQTTTIASMREEMEWLVEVEKGPLQQGL